MRYQAITTNDIANGAGIRVVLWVSGCNCACPGCHNPNTWDFNVGQEWGDAAWEELVQAAKLDYVQGLTFSGGHPLDPRNSPEVEKIAKRFKEMFPEKDIWVYTGYILSIEKLLSSDFENFDVIVDGPFVQEQRDLSLAFRGSRNQRIIDLNKTREKGEVVLWNS